MKLLFSVSMFLSMLFAQAEELVLVSPHWEGIRKEFEWGFKAHYKKMTGREIEFRWLDIGGTSDIIRFIKSEFRNGRPGIGIDILFGGGTDPFVELKGLKLLAQYRVPDSVSALLSTDLSGVQLYDPEFYWYSAALSLPGIVLNTAILSKLSLPEPKDWKDLANPAYKSWLASADPRKSGLMHMMYELILQAYGWDEGWQVIYGIAKNVRTFSSTATQVGKDLESGEVALGLTNDTYAGDIIRRLGADMIKFVIPESIISVVGDSIAIIKGAPNEKAAKMFIDFVLSEAGQKIFYLKAGARGGPQKYSLGKLPVLRTIYGNPDSASILRKDIYAIRWEKKYNTQLGASRWNPLNDLLGTFPIDNHVALSSPHLNSIELMAPVSEQQFQYLIDTGAFSSPLIRSKLLGGFSQQAYKLFQNEDKPSARFQHWPTYVLFLFIALGIGKYFLKLPQKNLKKATSIPRSLLARGRGSRN